MSTRPQPRPGVMQIEAYVPGKSKAAGVAKIHKLSSNETPLGPSPKAAEAIRTFDHLELYPDGCRHAFTRGDRGPLRARPEPAHLRCGLR